MAEGSPKPRILPQYVGAIIVTMGGLCLGTVIGWSSPADGLLNKKFPKSKFVNWISSIMPVGCAISSLITGFYINIIGRKYSVALMGIITTISYVILMFADTVVFYCVGRFIAGLATGSFCVTCPTYLSEFAHKDVRGQLATLFQLQIVIGILIAYSLGELESFWALNIPFAIIPLVMALLILFIPESPVHLFMKGGDESARKSLKFFRGPDYPLDDEIADLQEYTKKDEDTWQVMKRKATIKGFIILMGLHIVQQLSGINAVIFFAKPLFKSVTPDVNPGTASIILGVLQLIFTFISALLVDKAGRRLSWFISLAIMAVCNLLVGVHYETHALNKDAAKTTGYIAVASIYIYLAGFSLGTGPLPWVQLGEILPNSMKVMVSFVAFTNWMLAFLVTNSFKPMVDAFGAAVVFWIYCAFCVLGFFFVMFFVIETKGKSLEEIQKELEHSEQNT